MGGLNSSIAAGSPVLRALAGKIGWIAKGIVYALIGGLCCRAAADGNADVDASPQVCMSVT